MGSGEELGDFEEGGEIAGALVSDEGTGRLVAVLHVISVPGWGVELGSPGFEISAVRAAVSPSLHTQQGSPNSAPLDTPSPSESFWQNSTVYWEPAARKSAPSWLTANPTGWQSSCPSCGQTSVLSGFGLSGSKVSTAVAFGWGAIQRTVFCGNRA